MRRGARRRGGGCARHLVAGGRRDAAGLDLVPLQLAAVVQARRERDDARRAAGLAARLEDGQQQSDQQVVCEVVDLENFLQAVGGISVVVGPDTGVVYEDVQGLVLGLEAVCKTHDTGNGGEVQWHQLKFSTRLHLRLNQFGDILAFRHVPARHYHCCTHSIQRLGSFDTDPLSRAGYNNNFSRQVCNLGADGAIEPSAQPDNSHNGNATSDQTQPHCDKSLMFHEPTRPRPELPGPHMKPDSKLTKIGSGLGRCLQWLTCAC